MSPGHISPEQKVSESEIMDFAKAQLTLPDKFDPSDAMNWQHTLYSRLGGGRAIREEEEDKKLVPTVDNTVDRIVAMAKVLYGLHIVSVLLPCPCSPLLTLQGHIVALYLQSLSPVTYFKTFHHEAIL